MNEITLTPELARKIIAAYEAFDGGQIEIINQVSWENFRKFLSLIGKGLKTHTIEETVSLLRRLASEQEEILTARLPGNLAQLVKDYERWEELRQQAEQNPEVLPSLQVQAALLTRHLEQRGALPSEKESLEAWKEQEKEKQIKNLLTEAGVTRDEAEKLAPALWQKLQETSSRGPLASQQLQALIQGSGLPQEKINLVLERVQESGVVPVYTPIPTGSLRPIRPAPKPTVSEEKEPSLQKKEPLSEIQKLILLYGPRRRSFVGGVFRGLKSVVTGIKGVEDENLRPLVEAGIGKRELEQAIRKLQKEFPGQLPPDNIYLLYLRDILERLPQAQSPATDVRLLPDTHFDEGAAKTFFRIEPDSQGNIVIRRGYSVMTETIRSLSVPTRPVKNLLSSLQIKLRRFLESEKNIGFRFSLSGILALIGFLPGVPAPLRVLSLTLGVGLGGITALHPKTNITGRAGQVLTSGASRLLSFGRLLALAPAGEGVVILLVVGGALALIFGFVVFVAVPSYQSSFLGDIEAVTRPFGSRFINLEKVVSPAAQFENENIPDRLEYIIVVSASTEKRLTSVRVKDITRAEGENIDKELASQSWEIPEIPPTWSQKYTLEIDSNLKKDLADSLIINVVTIVADVEGEGQQSTSASLVVRIGNPPEECPSGWPTKNGAITQGPRTNESHRDDEAIDIGQPIGTPVYATHKGRAFSDDNVFSGTGVEVIGVCEGKTFRSYWWHLLTRIVRGGQEVKKGDLIGRVGSRGRSTGPHLHYEFRGLKMSVPYIPRDVPPCVGRVACNISW